MALYIIISLSAVLLILALDYVWILHRNPDLQAWPALSRCELCGKRIFAWQAHEFREYIVRTKGEVAYKIEASGLAHTGCKGVPEVEFHVEVIRGMLH